MHLLPSHHITCASDCTTPLWGVHKTSDPDRQNKNRSRDFKWDNTKSKLLWLYVIIGTDIISALPAAQMCFSTSANQTHQHKQKLSTNQHLIMCVVCVCAAGRCQRRTSRLQWEFSTCCSECSVSPHIVPFEQGTSGLWCKGTVHTESETSVVTSSLHADSFISFPSPDFFVMTICPLFPFNVSQPVSRQSLLVLLSDWETGKEKEFTFLCRVLKERSWKSVNHRGHRINPTQEADKQPVRRAAVKHEWMKGENKSKKSFIWHKNTVTVYSPTVQEIQSRIFQG